jgi:hypothetical protein
MYNYLKVEIRGPEESSFHEERISMLGSLARLSLLTINRVKSNPMRLAANRVQEVSSQ